MYCMLNLIKNVVIHHRVMDCFCKIQTDAVQYNKYSTVGFKLCVRSENEYLVGIFCDILYNWPYLILTLLYTAHL